MTMTGGINHAMNIPVNLFLSFYKMDSEDKCMTRVKQPELSCVFLFAFCLFVVSME